MHKFFAKPQFLGKNVIFLSECHSTNDFAASLLKKSSQIEGTTVITTNQTHGRGQRGNIWESAPGKNATFSVILRPTIVSVSDQFQLHIITTLAIHTTLFPILGRKLKIKWPNDIFYDNQKLGGILVENIIKGQKIEASVVGIGLNINQMHFDNKNASSLIDIIGQEFEINTIIEQILVELEKKYLDLKQGNIKALHAQYLRRLYLYNTEAAYMSNERSFSGTIVGVTSAGLLQIRATDEIHEFAFKEVSYL